MDEPCNRRMFPKNVAFFHHLGPLCLCSQSCCLSRCSCPKSSFHKIGVDLFWESDFGGEFRCDFFPLYVTPTGLAIVLCSVPPEGLARERQAVNDLTKSIVEQFLPN